MKVGQMLNLGQMGHCGNRQKWEGPEQTLPVERMEMGREDRNKTSQFPFYSVLILKYVNIIYFKS